jgi:tetratricopeptide (TPR) repeat protein
MKEQRSFLKGLFRAVKGDADGAIEAFRDAASAQLIAQAHTPAERVVAHVLLHRYEDALREADEAAAAAAGGEPYLLRARLLLALGDADGAFTDVRTALGRGTAVRAGDGLLGAILLAQGRLPEAIQELEADARAPAPDGAALLALGDAYRRAGRPEDAKAQYAAAAERARKDPLPDITWGRALVALATVRAGRLEEAREMAVRALVQYPQDPFVRVARALADIHLGSPTLAAADLEEVIDLVPARVLAVLEDDDRVRHDERLLDLLTRARGSSEELLRRIRARQPTGS